MKKILVEKSSYGIVLIVVFAFLSFFFRPTSVSKTEEGSAIIKTVELKREYNVALKSPSRGYNDYFEIEFYNSKKKHSCYSVEDIKRYGVKDIIDKKVEYQSFMHDEYAVLRNLSLDGEVIVKTNDIGYFPFLLFLGIFVVSVAWSIWGFYISYLASDEKRKEILEE